MLRGGKTLCTDATFRHVDVSVSQGLISGVGASAIAMSEIDLSGLFLVPGFVDLQVNGGGDVLFGEDLSAAGLRAIAEAHAQFGTTSFLPTITTTTEQMMRRGVSAVEDYLRNGGGDVLGLHLEGPSISKDRLGIHPREHVRRVFPLTDDLRDKRYVRLVTLAPEVVGQNVIEQLIASGVSVAVGHSEAPAGLVGQSIALGARLATHLFNAMSAPTARSPGVVGAFLDNEDAYVSMIADGVHVDPMNVRLAWRAKGAGRCILVTDAMPPVGGNQRSFLFGNQRITVADGSCRNQAGTLAGSALDMASAVRNCVSFGIPLEDALAMASAVPAKYLGLTDQLGSIEVGRRADLVVLASDLHVIATVKQGDLVVRARSQSKALNRRFEVH